MSVPPQTDSRVDQAAISDDGLLIAHEKLLGKQPDEKAHYRLLPLNLLFFFSGLIFFGGTYLGRYAGHFDPLVYNENVKRSGDAKGPTVAANPIEVGKKLFNNNACNTCHQAT